MNDIAIRVENLSKRYRIGLKEEMHDTLAGALVDFVTRPAKNLRRLRRLSTFSEDGHEPEDIIWALKDVSFEVRRGEVVGIIGRNGAGKTTLLKILSRITEPTRGRVELNGRVSSLLEVGTGFHPELTGRENIFLNGAVLGMTKAEIDRKFDEIVDFSGVEKFIDTPVKRYSSGMRVRLAFSVAAHLEPEILLVDEVLAVGDAEFQRKCLGKMKDVTGQGRTVLFVSHNMASIRGLCRRTLLIEQGQIAFDGETQIAVSRYLDRKPVTGGVVTGEELEKKGKMYLPAGEIFFRCKEIALLDQDGQPRNEFRSDEEITVSVTYECLQNVPNLKVGIDLTDEERTIILRTENLDDTRSTQYHLQPGLYQTCCVLPRNLLGTRQFYVSVGLIYKNVEHLDFHNILSFDVKFQGYNDNYSKWTGNAYIRPQLRWHTDTISKRDD